MYLPVGDSGGGSTGLPIPIVAVASPDTGQIIPFTDFTRVGESVLNVTVEPNSVLIYVYPEPSSTGNYYKFSSMYNNTTVSKRIGVSPGSIYAIINNTAGFYILSTGNKRVIYSIDGTSSDDSYITFSLSSDFFILSQ